MDAILHWQKSIIFQYFIGQLWPFARIFEMLISGVGCHYLKESRSNNDWFYRLVVLSIASNTPCFLFWFIWLVFWYKQYGLMHPLIFTISNTVILIPTISALKRRFLKRRLSRTQTTHYDAISRQIHSIKVKRPYKTKAPSRAILEILRRTVLVVGRTTKIQPKRIEIKIQRFGPHSDAYGPTHTVFF